MDVQRQIRGLAGHARLRRRSHCLGLEFIPLQSPAPATNHGPRFDSVHLSIKTGTARGDLPKGLLDAGKSPLKAAVRETWQETSLSLEPASLTDLGRYDNLLAKRLHLFALRVAPEAFPIEAMRPV